MTSRNTTDAASTVVFSVDENQTIMGSFKLSTAISSTCIGNTAADMDAGRPWVSPCQEIPMLCLIAWTVLFVDEPKSTTSMYYQEIDATSFITWAVISENEPYGERWKSLNTQKIENTFQFTQKSFGQEFTQLFYFLFCLFIFQEDEEYLVAWRVSQVQETLEKPGYRPCLV